MTSNNSLSDMETESIAEGSASSENMPLLEVRNLKKYFTSSEGSSWALQTLGLTSQEHVRAVDGVSFSLDENETLGVVGESGCGKSTLGRTILRLLEPTEGEILYKGEHLDGLSKKEMREKRANIQMIFQDPTSALNPRMKVRSLIAEPLRNFYEWTQDELDARIDELLEQVELPLEFKDRYPHELSGGQKQRVVIGRALATDPDLIVADEPVTGLDVSIQANIINMLQELQQEYELGILFIAHDLSVVRHVSDRVMVLYLGHAVEIGETEELFSRPQHPYTRALKSAIPRSHPNEEKHAQIPEGEPPSPINPPSGCPFHPRCPAYIGNECEDEYPSARILSNGRQVACHHFEDDDELRDENYDRVTLSREVSNE